MKIHRILRLSNPWADVDIIQVEYKNKSISANKFYDEIYTYDGERLK